MKEKIIIQYLINCIKNHYAVTKNPVDRVRFSSDEATQFSKQHISDDDIREVLNWLQKFDMSFRINGKKYMTEVVCEFVDKDEDGYDSFEARMTLKGIHLMEYIAECFNIEGQL